MPIGELRVGERLRLADGECANVASLSEEHAAAGEHFTTYNFEVADWHTYFVAPEGALDRDDAVWVHNDCPSTGFSPRNAEEWVAGAKGGVRAGKGSSIMTRLGRRKPDVTIASRKRLVEVKTGKVTYSRFNRLQVLKDRDILKRNLANGNQLDIQQVTWHFFKNKRGEVDVDDRLLRMLDRAGIKYRIFD